MTHRNWLYLALCLGCTVSAGAADWKPNRAHENLVVADSNQTVKAKKKPKKEAVPFLYSPQAAPTPTLLFDYYHRKGPSTKVGNYMVTGSWTTINGRYGWDDFVHTNTFDPVFVALEKEFAISMAQEPYSETLLATKDAVVIVNPDNPKLDPTANLITDAEIAMLRRYVEKGGSLMVMINSGGDDRAAEDFEGVQLRKLVRSFGLDWNSDDTHYSDVTIGENHPYFYDVPIFHYGSGCTLKILPEAKNPTVLMQVASDAGYPDRNVKGPGIVMTRPGKGKFILVGDNGSWTGNMSRPWAENERILKQLFRYLKPDQGVKAPQLPADKTFTYEVTVAELQGIPVTNTLTKVEHPHFKMFSPRPATNMPYLEATASLTLKVGKHSAEEAAPLTAEVTGFRWFEEGPQEKQQINFVASRQGKVSQIEAKGHAAQWLAPDIPVLVPLLPVDGIRPGDHWESLESVRIPMLNGTDLPPVKPTTMSMTYINDTELAGRACRLIRATGEVWLSDLGVRVEDLLPDEEARQVGGSRYRFFNEHGGKILYKREQWVDRETGTVIKGRVQTRIVAWIQDKTVPVGSSNAVKDQQMIVSMAHSTTFNLKE
ncbi:hypothetical protein [Larkinella sp. C7]|jgi:hypothetical protein|uniref:hypothetical protein n=1 Tax=Larkinella sp. C7 TaxID=2576607 RepID=UPI0011111C19|nr:hypothetical protein [Larkinella sp. C7]